MEELGGRQGVADKMRYRVRTDVRVEQIDSDVLVLDSKADGVHRLTGDAAEALRLAQEGVAHDAVPTHLRDSMSDLLDTGLVARDGWSRRKVLAAGATGLGVGISYLSLPSPAAAATGGGDTAPGAPTINSVNPVAQTTATVNFTPPADDGGSPITAYQYSLNGGGFQDSGWTSGDSNSFQLSGLVHNTAYSLVIRAVNGIGAGDPSNTFNFTTRVAAPTITSVDTGSTTASIAYTAPAGGGGATISAYQYSLDGGTTWSGNQPVANPLPVSGLTSGTTYQFAIRAVNAAGPGATSNVVTTTTDGSTTFNTPGATTWNVPAGVTSFTVQAWGGGGGGNRGSTTRGGGGGGGGGYSTGTVTVTASSYTVTVGAGGNGGTTASTATAGGASSVSTVVAGGGAAGNPTGNATGGTGTFVGGTGGSGGQSSGQSSNGGGGGGGEGAGTTATGGNGANGGNNSGGAGGTGTDGGDGGAGANSGATGSPGSITGGGGGGGGRTGAGVIDGGNGARGRVIISWT